MAGDSSGRTRAEVYRDSANCWRSRIFDANGHVLFVASEGYRDKDDCVRQIKSRFGPIPIEYLDEA